MVLQAPINITLISAVIKIIFFMVFYSLINNFAPFIMKKQVPVIDFEFGFPTFF